MELRRRPRLRERNCVLARRPNLKTRSLPCLCENVGESIFWALTAQGVSDDAVGVRQKISCLFAYRGAHSIYREMLLDDTSRLSRTLLLSAEGEGRTDRSSKGRGRRSSE